MKTKEFLYRLLFDKEDSLDLFQILYYIIVVVTLVVIWRITGSDTNPENIKEGLITLRYMMGLLVVTAVPKWLAQLLVKQKDPKPDDGSEVS